MHTAIQLSILWAAAFFSLSTALVLLNTFYSLIGDGLELLGLGKEAVVAAIASLVEALSLWLVLSFVPAAGRALIIPALIMVLIYKVAHLEDWGRLEIFLLLIFQLFIGGLGATLFYGQFQMAITILVGFGVVLAIIAAFARAFSD